jgi:hypothetical protein
MQPKKKELFQIAGDPHAGGAMSGVNLNKNATCNPVVLYKSKAMGDIWLTLDVYAMPGMEAYAIIYCPQCQTRDPENKRNMSLTIKQSNKKIELDTKAVPKFPGYNIQEVAQGLGLQSIDEMRGVISIEPFGCTWEESAEQNKGATGIVGGLISGCCDWQVVIENNIARDV